MRKFVVIKTSGGVITDVWKEVAVESTPISGRRYYRLCESDLAVIEVMGEIVVLEFNLDTPSHREKYNSYYEYHLVTDLIPYVAFAKAKFDNANDHK